MKRAEIALQILNGACAGDWKFDIPTGMKWETVAALRAFEIADAFIDVATGKITFNKEEPKVETVPEKTIKVVKKPAVKKTKSETL